MYLYVVILPEHAQLAEPVLGPWSGEIIDGLAIFADVSATWGIMSYTEKALTELGVAFNMGIYTNGTNFKAHSVNSFRVDHTGQVIPYVHIRGANPALMDPNGIRRQLLHLKLTLQTRDIDRIANVLYLRDSWEHQVEYGKLHRMMRLIGATE